MKLVLNFNLFESIERKSVEELDQLLDAGLITPDFYLEARVRNDTVRGNVAYCELKKSSNFTYSPELTYMGHTYTVRQSGNVYLGLRDAIDAGNMVALKHGIRFVYYENTEIPIYRLFDAKTGTNVKLGINTQFNATAKELFLPKDRPYAGSTDY
jgi:hypothetical protein